MCQNDEKEVHLYNVMFPFWMLIWFPSALWLILIPLNYLIDALVFWLSARKTTSLSFPEALKRSGKICIAGFISDFVGSALLFLTNYFSGDGWLWKHIGYPVMWNPFSDVFGFLYTLCAIAVSGLLIYLLDKRILTKQAVLSPEQAKRTAIHLAIFTAPYTFLIPSSLIYPPPRVPRVIL
ncbi:MAG: hypothetical protein IJ091_09480 [Oscillospiraceae bacterium]|nr:hypothetical protein [Oscillospiraceae bacterium]